MLTREIILAASDRPVTAVLVPEWGGTVYVPKLSLAEAAEFAKLPEDKKGGGILAARIVLDADGRRLFVDADADALAAKNAVAIGRIIAAFTAANSVTTPELDAATKN